MWWWGEQCEEGKQQQNNNNNNNTNKIFRLLFNDDHSWALDLFLFKRIIASLFYGGIQQELD
jgi:hypothetical protein